MITTTSVAIIIKTKEQEAGTTTTLLTLLPKSSNLQPIQEYANSYVYKQFSLIMFVSIYALTLYLQEFISIRNIRFNPRLTLFVKPTLFPVIMPYIQCPCLSSIIGQTSNLFATSLTPMPICDGAEVLRTSTYMIPVDRQFVF